MPGATNLPLLTDEERHQVGVTYKSSGQSAAIDLGNRLVSGSVRDERIRSWKTFAENHPDAWLYCWRGGLRSETVQAWLAQQGIDLPRVNGGFKALRRHCLEILEHAPETKRWLVVAGRTGSGKTEFLARCPQSIDLERLANHRGSAFGAMSTPQPTPIDFENTLAVKYLQHEHEIVLLEDESRTIGRLAIPAAWHAAMQEAPLLVLEVQMTTRCRKIAQEYVHVPLAEGVPAEELHARYALALDKIERRLGGLRKKQIRSALDEGFRSESHHEWIEMLLSEYYDPMYDYQLAEKDSRVIVRGDAQTLLDFL